MSDDGKINSNFRGNKIPKEGLHCVCLSVKMIDSVVQCGQIYYPQIYFGRIQI